jgi:hypothetical protein
MDQPARTVIRLASTRDEPSTRARARGSEPRVRTARVGRRPIICRAGLVESARADRKVGVMTTSPTVSFSSPTPAERVPLRLHLDNSFQSGPLDGAWWPQSRDSSNRGRRPRGSLSRSGRPGLAAAVLRSRLGRGQRCPEHPPDPGRAVKVGSFPSDDTHVMIVTMSSGQRLRLLVVPADTEPGLASRAMQQAADDRNSEGAGTLLGLPGRTRARSRTPPGTTMRAARRKPRNGRPMCRNLGPGAAVSTR